MKVYGLVAEYQFILQKGKGRAYYWVCILFLIKSCENAMKTVFRLKLLPASLPLCLLILFSFKLEAAEEKPVYDRITFIVTVEGEIENDRVTATLFSNKTGPNLAELARDVNQAVSEGIKRVQKEPSVAIQTLGYESYPDYQNGKPVGWQVRQAFRLVSHNPELLAKLIGELQSGLAVGGIEYSVSPDKLHHFEDKLLDQGLSDFRRRAERITKDMGRTRYRVVNIQLNTPGQSQYRPQMQMKSMAVDAASPAPPPSLQAGKEHVEVEVNGTIELQPN